MVSGQPGEHKNREHFLANGLDRAKKALEKRNSKSEKVTWMVYNDGSKEYGYSEKEQLLDKNASKIVTKKGKDE